MRERGLKLFPRLINGLLLLSLSLRERGLKCLLLQTLSLIHGVALLARAWIEISAITDIGFDSRVALLARAWIEIL